MLVEELLKLLVDIVDADLLEAVVVKDLEAGDVEDADVGDLLHCWVTQGLVTLVHCKNESIETFFEELQIIASESAPFQTPCL